MVLSRYIEPSLEVLDRRVLPELLKLNYEAIEDGRYHCPARHFYPEWKTYSSSSGISNGGQFERRRSQLMLRRAGFCEMIQRSS
ncbi:hypothetical protein V202x_53310 [Gimesia aquarii]|uniref:Uncharacterized protein n=1 Tax=Gimesia aquarii TaxID=2527964 RepID=A0A517X319_9PLAN|nr:hypothetical protein V202x_53310 [Gimesia aquarii]